MRKIRLNRRATIIAIVHMAVSLIVLFAAMILTAKGIPEYPEHVHPPAFVIFQRIMNFPIVLFVSYLLLFVVKTFQIEIGMNAMFAIVVASIMLNSSLWGFCIDKMICFMKREET